MSANVGAASPRSDDEGVLAVMEELERAWASGDADGFGALHTEACSYVAFDGTVMRGAEGVADGHRALFTGILRDSRLVTQHRDVRFVTPEAAVVVQRGGVVMSWQRGRTAPSRKRLSTSTTLLTFTTGRWQVAAFQNTRFRPWAETLVGRLMTRRTR
ncbi:SgcJ/EcaC family oxidoreductase [Cellulomonas sp. NS3]|uniref:SgcJ/EcaC family oxidoreductase n=1 Tax=Cellulomonas sp. NS3 TaxID=2973977 RepID=UPI002163D6E7|nr:SgcJ/EcaC family oxidoreductase [Cellulomonas sp. NS3]